MEFIDRVSKDPGRVLITPEDPEFAPFFARMSLADNPTQEGTPLNAETFSALGNIEYGTCGLTSRYLELFFEHRPLVVFAALDFLLSPIWYGYGSWTAIRPIQKAAYIYTKKFGSDMDTMNGAMMFDHKVEWKDYSIILDTCWGNNPSMLISWLAICE